MWVLRMIQGAGFFAKAAPMRSTAKSVVLTHISPRKRYFAVMQWLNAHTIALRRVRFQGALKNKPALAKCWSYSPTHLTHSPKDDPAVAIHALRPSLEGSRENCGEPCRLFPSDIPGRSSVVVTTRRLCAINTRAPFDHVEVDLQNALLAKDELRYRHQCGLRTLAEDGAARTEEQVFYQLLRNSGTSARAIALQIFLGSELDRVPIEPMVMVEACVLRGDYSVLEIGRDLAERDEFVALVIRRAVYPGLQAALNVHRS